MALTLTRPSTKSRAAGVLAALGALALLAGCSGGGPELLANRVCQEEHLPEGFERLTFGNISPRDLGREVGAETLAAAGVDGGYFTYWKEILDELQDDLAVEVVCQVVAFGDAGEASQFVADLPAEADWLSVTVAGIALAEGTTLTEVEAEGRETRAFRFDEGEGRVRYAVVAARGRFVLSVHLGGPEGGLAVGDAVAILEGMGR